MSKEFIEKTSFSKAYAAWFSEYERERRTQKKRKGSTLTGFPAPPASPQDIAFTLDQVGIKNALAALGVHRCTLARWLSGQSVIPRSAWLLLVLMADGRLPGMSTDWSNFRFDGDLLCLVGTRQAYTAREIAGWPMQIAHMQALSRRILELEKEKAHLLKVGDFKAANEPFIRAG